MIERDIDDPAPASSCSGKEPLHDGLKRLHAGSDITDRNSDPGRPVLGAVDGAQPTFRLDKEVIGLLLSVRTFAAIAADRAANQRRVAIQKLIQPKPHPLDSAGGKILDEHISAGDHRSEDGLILVLPQVQTDRFLAAVEPDEIGAFAVHDGIVRPREIPLCPFDLDDPGAGIRQPGCAIRRRDGLLHGDDEHPVERFQGIAGHGGIP